MSTIILKSLDDIQEAAKAFLKQTEGKKHFAFYGGMGAGKTTFIKAICEELKVEDVVASPTFAIINEYSSKEAGAVFHFDFYRIEDTEEVLNLGYEDYFYGESYCFIEWPELVEELLPEHIIRVNIEEELTGERIITINPSSL